MGGPKKTRSHIFQHYKGQAALLTEAEVYSDKYLGQRFNVTSDALTDFYTITGKDSEYFMTANEFFGVIRASLEREFARGAQTIVISCDDQDVVPIEKGDEQAERSKNSAEPYPDTTVLCDEGIRETPDADPMMFDTRRLMASRIVRVALYDYLVTKFKTMDLVAGLCVIFEYKDKIVHIFEPKLSYRTSNQYPHHHGEAEVSVCFWTALLRESRLPMKIKSTDTDEIIVMMEYLKAPYNREQIIIWQYYDIKNKKPAYINFTLFIDNLLTVSKLNPTQWCIYWCLGGCDYLKKKLCTNQFNIGAILEAITEATPVAAAAMDNGITFDTSGLECILRCLYTPACLKKVSKKRKMTAIEEREQAEERVLKQARGPTLFTKHEIRSALINTKYTFPTDEVLDFANTRIRKKINYWIHQWKLYNPSERNLPLPNQVESRGALCESCDTTVYTKDDPKQTRYTRCINCNRRFCLKADCQTQATAAGPSHCPGCDPTQFGFQKFCLITSSSSSSTFSSSSL